MPRELFFVEPMDCKPVDSLTSLTSSALRVGLGAIAALSRSTIRPYHFGKLIALVAILIFSDEAEEAVRFIGNAGGEIDAVAQGK